jgi:hypothetical protein
MFHRFSLHALRCRIKSVRCDIYIDESSQTKHRYLLLGGLIIPTQQITTFDAAAVDARGTDLPAREMGWTKVSRSKLEAYRRFVSIVSALREIQPLDFHCIVIDTHKIDDALYNEGSREAGFNKEIYQLVMKFDKLYPLHDYHVYLDQRSTATIPSDLRLVINRGMMKRNRLRDWPVRRLHYRDSANCHCLQLVDVLLGGVAYHVNGHRQKGGASAAKCELSDFVLKMMGITDVSRDTAIRGRFTMWRRQLGASPRRS